MRCEHRWFSPKPTRKERGIKGPYGHKQRQLRTRKDKKILLSAKGIKEVNALLLYCQEKNEYREDRSKPIKKRRENYINKPIRKQNLRQWEEQQKTRTIYKRLYPSELGHKGLWRLQDEIVVEKTVWKYDKLGVINVEPSNSVQPCPRLEGSQSICCQK